MNSHLNKTKFLLCRSGIVLLLLTFICFTNLSVAQEFQFIPDVITNRFEAAENPNYVYGDRIHLVTQDLWEDMKQNPGTWSQNYTFKSIANIIKVGINHDSKLIGSNFKYRIEIRFKGYNNPANPLSAINEQGMFDLEYNKDSLKSYKDQNTIKFGVDGYHEMDVWIANVYDVSNPNAITPLLWKDVVKNFYIESSIITQRYDKKTLPLSTSSFYNPANHELNVGWAFYQLGHAPDCDGIVASINYKPVKYELEWTYVDDYQLVDFKNLAGSYRYKNTANSFSIPYSFKNNATRIQTYETNFTIPVIYEHGSIVFRVRTIRPDPNDYTKMIYSDWTLPENGVLTEGSFNSAGYVQSPYRCYNQCVCLIPAAMEGDRFDWQYSINFAEDGKYKHVLNYFDGAGHNRQTQTKINSDHDYIVAADHIYDYEGRPAIQTLPTPVISQNLNFKPDLSYKLGTVVAYNAADFDNGCSTDSIQGFDKNSLAGRYYSPSNPDKEGMQQFVPDAQGYPFIESIYSPDNKVIWQGGAGIDFQRFKNHGTSTAYVRANQNELNTLFGTQAGRYEYYPKVVTRDPNGQLSYSIFNQTGKVIATALAGSAPLADSFPIVPLDGTPTGTSIATDILANLNQTIGDGLRNANYAFFPEAEGDNIFLYHGYIPAYETKCSNQYINLKGTYNIKIVDECGTVQKQQGPVTVGVTSIDTSALGKTFAGVGSGNIKLSPQKYTLIKELYFADSAITRLANDFTVANSAPDKCYDYEDAFIRRSIEASTFPCKSDSLESHCDIVKRKMKDELYPGAKYGGYIKNEDGTFARGIPNSIFTQINDAGQDISGLNSTSSCYYIQTCGAFYEGDVVPSSWSTGPYQFAFRDTQIPCAPGTVIQQGDYAVGTYHCRNSDIICPDLNAKYRYKWNCSILPSVSQPVAGSNPPFYALLPANDLSPDGLIANFSDAIAEKLLPYHPEYCKLLLCDDHLEDILKKITSYKDAEALGLNTLTKIYSQDPLCNVNPNGVFTPDELSKLAIAIPPVNNNYAASNLLQKIDKLALEKAYCGCESPEAYAYCRTKQYVLQIQNMQMVDTQVQNTFIRNLIALYIANRNVRVQQRMDNTAGTTCEACGNKRMQLVGDPVFAPVFSGNTISASLGFPPGVKAALDQALTGAQGGMPDTMTNFINANAQISSDQQVDSILAAMSNCVVANPIFLANIRANLKNLNVGGAYGEKLTPEKVASAFTAAGVSINNLCNPYLAQYGWYDTATKVTPVNFINKDPAFYAGLKQFLTRVEIRQRLYLASATTSGTGWAIGTFSAANKFENDLAASVGVANNGSFRATAFIRTLADPGTLSNVPRDVIMLIVGHTAANNFDTLYFTKRVGISQPPACSPIAAGNVKIVNASSGYPGFSFTEIHSILDDSLFNNLSDGYIADNLVFAQVAGKAGPNNLASCDNYAIWSYKVPMLKRKDPSAMDDCINCVQMRMAVKSYFADAAGKGLPVYTNHQNFKKIFSNYLNLKLKKRHDYYEYEKLMEGCALSNFITFNATKGQYHLVYNAASLNTMNALINDINTTINGNVGYFTYKDASGNIHAWIDGTTIPQTFAYTIQQKINTAQPAALTVDEPDIITEVWVPQNGCTVTPGFGYLSATAGASVTGPEAVSLQNVDGTYSQSYNRYILKGATTLAANGNEKAIANIIQITKENFTNPANGCGGVLFSNGRDVMRTADFTTNTDRQAYLSYVYSQDGQSQAAISSAISAGVLKGPSGIAPFNTSAIVSYQDPWCSGVKTDLNYAPNTTTASSNWTLMNDYFNSVKAKLGNAKLFPANNITTITGTGAANELPSFKAIKMANGTIWYRIFTGPNKRMNFYLSPAENMVGSPNDYAIATGATFEPVIGPDTVYRFKILMQKTVANVATPHYVTCYGWADFPLMASKSISNVVLSDFEGNRGCTDTLPCERIVMQNAIQQGRSLYASYIDSIKANHYLAMRNFFPANTIDTLDFTTQKQQYQYTLYNYDLVGNLTSTVPPMGVTTMTNISAVDKARNDKDLNTTFYPADVKKSEYWYNSYNQLLSQTTPDGAQSYFFYDNANRLTFSINQKQINEGKQSYTLYDPQGRIEETGEVLNLTYLFTVNSKYGNAVRIAQEVRQYKRENVVRTFYDEPLLNLTSNAGLNTQENLRKRVSSILYAAKLDIGQTPESYYSYGTHFSYDALGNVKTLVQDNPYLDYLGQRFKRIDYDYDLLSGKVNMVSYNRGHNDQFYQKYTYDADNRITTTQSSNDALTWDRDVSYEYYKHGPLAQMNVGDLAVQSLQYAYTIQGWLKAINGDVLDTAADMGHDGRYWSAFPPDVIAHSLDYYKNDYKAIGKYPVTYADAVLKKGLYNGNIARQTTGISTMDNLQRDYTYDQLNRIKETKYSKVDNLSHAVTAMANAFANTYSYDKDGNILKLTRKNENGTLIDDFTYSYANNNLNNKLGSVADVAANTSGSDLPQGQLANNYSYDWIGNLVKDVQGKIDTVKWNAYGKVTDMKMEGGNKNIHYDYDATGNRVRKDVSVKNGTIVRASDVYVRDASGNILAVYKGKGDGETGGFKNDDITDEQEHGKWTSPVNINFGAPVGPFISGGDYVVSPTIDSQLIVSNELLIGTDTSSILIDTTLAVNDTIGQQTPLESSLEYTPELGYGREPSGGGTVIEVELTGTLNPDYTPPIVNTPTPIGLDKDTLYLAEHHLYGSRRLGIKTYDADKYRVIYAGGPGTSIVGSLTENIISSPLPWYNLGLADWLQRDKVLPYSGTTYNLSIDGQQNIRILGAKQYELTDHLGNVLATVLDKRTGYGNDGGRYIGYYANLASVTDYYPGGFEMPGRFKSFSNYRFGNQKQEKDNEVYGEGNVSAFKYRFEDTRLNRFFSVDPLYAKYPGNSQYAFSENRLIDAFELEGKESVHFTKYAYTGSWTDYFKTIPNAASTIMQGLADVTWNSGLANVESLKRGTWAKDVGGEFSQMPGAAKQYVKNSWNYTVNTPIGQQFKDAATPQSVETMLAFTGSVILTKKAPSLNLGDVNLAARTATKTSVAEPLPRVFWSGTGTEAKALADGFKTLGKTRAGENLAILTENMEYKPGSQAYNMWARLSTAYAKGASGVVHVYQLPLQQVGNQSIWRLFEYPALKANPKVTKIIFHY